MPSGPDERENFNRIRTWLNCFSVDKAHAAQFGKMHMVSLDDQVIRKTLRTWYKSNPTLNAPYDSGLCAYTEMLLLLAKFRHATGFDNDLQQKYLEVCFPIGNLDPEAILTPFGRALMWLRTQSTSTNNFRNCLSGGLRHCKLTITMIYVSSVSLAWFHRLSPS
jgi:hypothetical protein